MDSLNSFICNGEKVFQVDVLMGIGTSQSVFSALAQAFESSGVKIKYFQASSEIALGELSAGSYYLVLKQRSPFSFMCLFPFILVLEFLSLLYYCVGTCK